MFLVLDKDDNYLGCIIQKKLFSIWRRPFQKNIKVKELIKIVLKHFM